MLLCIKVDKQIWIIELTTMHCRLGWLVVLHITDEWAGPLCVSLQSRLLNNKRRYSWQWWATMRNLPGYDHKCTLRTNAVNSDITYKNIQYFIKCKYHDTGKSCSTDNCNNMQRKIILNGTVITCTEVCYLAFSEIESENSRNGQLHSSLDYLTRNTRDLGHLLLMSSC